MVERFPMAVEDVSAIAARTAPAAWSRVSYDNGCLVVPDDLAPVFAALDIAELRKQRLRDRALARRRDLLSRPITVGGRRTWVDNGTRLDVELLSREFQSVAFKFVDGFATVTAPELARIGRAITHYVAGVFANESTVHAGIEAGTITSDAELDAVWPPQPRE